MPDLILVYTKVFASRLGVATNQTKSEAVWLHYVLLRLCQEGIGMTFLDLAKAFDKLHMHYS